MRPGLAEVRPQGGRVLRPQVERGEDPGHRGSDAKLARFATRRGDHTTFSGTANGDRLAPKVWSVPLFDRRVERIHVDVNDLAWTLRL